MLKALKAKGYKLNYGKNVKMPANYVLLYNPSEPNKCGKLLDKNDSALKKFATEIEAGTQSVRQIPLVLNNMYKNIESLDFKFAVKDSCTSCGLCEKICPVRNIRLESGKPEWLRRCEHCVGCISWCPARAIEYGNKTYSRNRYYNPRIKADELIRKD